MTTGLGGIAYDERAALYTGAAYEDVPGNEAELILVETDGNFAVEDEAEKRTAMTDEEQLEVTSRELEAYAIAARIKELVGTHLILDKKTGEYRPARYGDIVILTRSLKGWTEDFSNILNKEGIPTFSGTKEGYFETWEVSTVLDYLNLLDNLRQDLPMASVLLSPFAGMKAEELAKIRANAPDVQFFEAVFQYKDDKEAEPEICRKLDIFQKQYEAYRKILPYTSIHDLLWKLLEETGYRDYVGAMPGGRQRQANLDMLVEKAIAFESTSYKGLFHFVRYIRQLQKYDVDYGEANISDEQADTVRLMSIHKSKGLEFPIVFAAGMGKMFNTQDIRDQLVVHPELGIGMDAIDLILRTKTPTLLKKVIQKETALENLAEEQRVLYVALTRAKEKLIITGAVKDVQKKLAAYGAVRARRETELSFAGLSRARTYLDWIIPALIRHSSFADILAEYDMQASFANPIYKEEVPIRARIVRPAELLQGAFEEEAAGNLLEEFLKYRIDSGETFHKEMQEQMQEQFVFVYPFSKDRTRKLKFTVSELKKMQYPGEEEESEVLFEAQEEEKLVPKFMRDDAPLTGTSRGTAYHRVLELLDFTKEYDRESLTEAVSGFVKSGKLTKEAGVSVRIADLEAFFRTDIAGRMRKAAVLGKLWKEQPFVIGLEEDGEMILVQGIIDAYIEEEGKLTVIDYKTDRVKKAGEIRERYHRQLEYYAQALGQMLCSGEESTAVQMGVHDGRKSILQNDVADVRNKKELGQKIIYSFALRKEIEV